MECKIAVADDSFRAKSSRLSKNGFLVDTEDNTANPNCSSIPTVAFNKKEVKKGHVSIKW